MAIEFRKGRAALVFEVDTRPFSETHTALLPCLVLFPQGTDRADAHDLTLAWLRFGVTLRWYVRD